MTINLPETASVELIEELYMIAWQSGCKGSTVYRSGSLDGVLVSNEPKKEKKCDCITDNQAPKRPKKLKAKIVRFNNNKEKWVAVIGLDANGRPYEIFTGLSEKLSIPSYVKEGEIVKVRQEDAKHYNFVYKNDSNEEVTIKHLDATFNSEYWNYARLVSSMFRYGIPLTVVIKMINDMRWDTDMINTWKNGVIRAIKPFIKDGTKSGLKCTNCGDEMVLEGGCNICKSCGESKCG